MNVIINKFFLAGDKSIPKLHLRQPVFTYSAYGAFIKKKEELKNLNKQDIQDRFIKTNWIKLTFNMILLTKTLKIYLEEQFPIKYYVIKHLILLRIQNMMDVEEVLHRWIISSLIKQLQVVLLKVKLCQTNNTQKYYTNQFEKRKTQGILIF